jgi:hypothetical protein
MKTILTNLLCLLAILFHTSLEARRPFHALAVVNTTSAEVSATNLVDLSRELKTESLEELIPIYTPTSPIAIGINLRGIDVITAFAANSNVLTVAIPQADIITSFEGVTRDDSITLFKDFLKDNGRRGQLLRAYAKYSPIDPIAGNPASLLSQLGQADYNMGRLSLLSGCECCWNTQPVVHQFQIGAQIWRAFSQGYDTTSVFLPIQYSYSPMDNWAFIIDAPLTFHDNGGAYTLFGSVGLGLHLPVTEDWSLTPVFRLGSGGSLDLATSASLLSTGVTSVYDFHLFDGILAMTNYAAYITSTNLWLSGINFNYRLQTWVFKNGLSFTTCEGFDVCNRPIHLNLYWVDTQFTSGRLFIKHHDEIGFDLFSTGINPCLDYDLLSVGFSYQFGQKDYKAYCFNFKYQF